jgi:hypothetical protein
MLLACLACTPFDVVFAVADPLRLGRARRERLLVLLVRVWKRCGGDGRSTIIFRSWILLDPSMYNSVSRGDKD